MSPNNLDDYTEKEAKDLLNDICHVFSIGESARSSSIIMTNVKNAANDEFCKHKKVIKFLEGRTFRLIKKANGYIFTMPYGKSDFHGETIMEAVEKAIDFDDEITIQTKGKK